MFEGYETGSLRDKGKGKAREQPPPTPQRHPRDRSKSVTDDEPWKHMEMDGEPNPFARLDRDYPQHAAPSAPEPPAPGAAPTQNASHPDLNSVRPTLHTFV